MFCKLCGLDLTENVILAPKNKKKKTRMKK